MGFLRIAFVTSLIVLHVIHAIPARHKATQRDKERELLIELKEENSVKKTVYDASVLTKRQGTHPYKVVCYYTNWAQYRPAAGRYTPEHIDPNLCTHIVYAFATMKNGKLAPYEWNDDDMTYSKGMYSKTMELKKVNPKLKVLIAIGGWNFGTKPFTAMVATEQTRKAFIADAITFLRTRNFDGLDWDWEYPAKKPDSPPEDKQKFTVLLKENLAAFEEEARTSGKPRLLITAAVAAGQRTIDAGYEIAEISKYLDFINLMSYDLHGSWEPRTGLNSPLCPRAAETGDQRKLNVDFAVNYWLQKGCPKEKLIMGMGTYGRSFLLSSASNHGLSAPATDGWAKQPYTGEKGYISYYEICRLLKSGWQSVFDEEHKAPYAYSSTRGWVGYDNPKSIALKTKYVVDNGLGGAMVWAIDLDDFKGEFCGEGKYPLMNTIDAVFKNPLAYPSTSCGTTPPTTTGSPATATPSTTAAPPITPSSAPSGGESQYQRVCYHTNWSQYRKGGGVFVPEDIDPFLCTHIIYSFAKMVDGKIAATEDSDISSGGMYSRTMALKEKNPKLKILLAIGGYNMGSAPFTAMVAKQQNRLTFIFDAIVFLRKYSFDGLDWDWEYPANRGSPTGDKEKFALLLQETRAAFQAEAKQSGKTELLMTAAVAAGKSYIDSAYDVPAMAKSLDFINLMAYDLHGSWESAAGHNSPLYPRTGESGYQRYLNQDWSVNYWLGKGCPKKKLILGLGMYGRSFKLANSNNYAMGAPTTGAYDAQEYTGEPGYASYYEVCLLKQKGWTEKWQEDQMVPYAHSGIGWIGYDNVKSIGIKSQYIVNRGLGGAMIWALDLDDFNGNFCNEGKYPLLSKINAVLNAEESTTSETKAPVTTKSTTQAPATTKSTTQAPVTTKATTKAPVTTKATTKAPVTTKATTKAPVTTKSTTKAPVTTKATTQAPVTTKPTTKQSTTPATTPSGEFQCKSNGKFLDINSCEKYWECIYYGTRWQQKLHRACAKGTAFRHDIKICDWKHNVAGCDLDVTKAPGFECTEDGVSQDFDSCDFYWICSHTNTIWEKATKIVCPANTKFNPDILNCDYSYRC